MAMTCSSVSSPSPASRCSSGSNAGTSSSPATGSSPSSPTGAAASSPAGGSTVNACVLVPVPAGLVTEMGPVLAPSGTTTRSSVSVAWVTPAASTPPKVTVCTPVKPVPWTTTRVPAAPSTGSNVVTSTAASLPFGAAVNTCSKIRLSHSAAWLENRPTRPPMAAKPNGLTVSEEAWVVTTISPPRATT
jgi:hypothetical protein